MENYDISASVLLSELDVKLAFGFSKPWGRFLSLELSCTRFSLPCHANAEAQLLQIKPQGTISPYIAVYHIQFRYQKIAHDLSVTTNIDNFQRGEEKGSGAV
jgi:hypothetical protein